MRSWSEVINRRSRAELIEAIIEKELTALFYASPTIQFRYFEAVLDIELDESIKTSWSEIKAARDLLVHNSSIINRLYLRKAGDAARGMEGEKLVIDSEYMGATMAAMKSLVGKTCSKVQANLKTGA